MAVKRGVVNSVQSSVGKVGDDSTKVKISRFELEIPTDRILSSSFIFWLVC